jgi:hypothetical protein
MLRILAAHAARGDCMRPMWFGVLYLDAEEVDDPASDGDMAIVHGYAPEGVFTVGGSPAMVPMTVRLLRRAAGPGRLQAPRCRGCGASVEVPPLDLAEDTCASA